MQVFYGNGYRVHYNIAHAKIPTAHGNDIAGTLAIIAAILCHYDGTTVPKAINKLALQTIDKQSYASIKISPEETSKRQGTLSFI